MTKRRGSNKSKAPKNAIVIKEPLSTDVLFGRGGHVNHNQGNQKYLELVCQRKEEYHDCKKTDKADIAWDIIRQLREQVPCPRFLKKDYESGLWHVVDDADVRRKISQCLRERATPVCPKAKRSKQKKTSPPKLRLSLRSSSIRVEDEDESRDKTDSEDEAWQPREAEVATRPISGRVTRLGKQQMAARDRQMSRSLSTDAMETEEIIAEQALNLPVEDIKAVPAQQKDAMEPDLLSTGIKPSVPPPLPAPKPIQKEGSSRIWSDFLSIFDSKTEEILAEQALNLPFEDIKAPSHQKMDVASGAATTSIEPSVPPPLPAPKPFQKEGSSRLWSDISLPFAPGSIFDFSNGVEGHFQDLLPDLDPEDDQSSSSGEQDAIVQFDSAYSSKRAYSQSISRASVGWAESMSPPKRRKLETIDVPPGFEATRADFVDAAEGFDAVEASAT